MTFELTKFPSIRYTMMENHLFDALPKNGKKVNSADIVEMRKKMGDWDVKFPLKNITVTMQRLLEKIDDNEEPFRIAKAGKEEGHHKVEYWIEARAPVRKKRKGERQMTAVIRAVMFAGGTPCPHAGQWLKSFDHEAFNGQGHGVFTDDPDEAMRFDTKAEAMIFWRHQSRSKPWRPDGKPNRPLTALTVEIEELL